MSQKTLTINGRRYTGRSIAKLMTTDTMIDEYIYRVPLADGDYIAEYRHDEGDAYHAPICGKAHATDIRLECASYYRPAIWLTYEPPAKRPDPTRNARQASRRAALDAAARAAGWASWSAYETGVINGLTLCAKR